MKRTAEETAKILEELHGAEFDGDYLEPFKLSWGQMRRIAGISKLTDAFLAEVGECLVAEDYALLTFNNIFVIAKEGDFANTRSLTSRIAEGFIPSADGEGEELEPPDDGDDEKEEEDCF